MSTSSSRYVPMIRTGISGSSGARYSGQQQRGIVCPVQVLKHEQQRLCLRATGDEFAEAVPQISSRELRRQFNGRGDVG